MPGGTPLPQPPPDNGDVDMPELVPLPLPGSDNKYMREAEEQHERETEHGDDSCQAAVPSRHLAVQWPDGPLAWAGTQRTGGREYAGTVHNHKTIAFPHIDGLAWLLNTHSDSGVSTGVAEAPVSHARNQRVHQAPTTASDRQSVPCHVVTL